jgi:hypothetical protein
VERVEGKGERAGEGGEGRREGEELKIYLLIDYLKKKKGKGEEKERGERERVRKEREGKGREVEQAGGRKRARGAKR